MPRVDAYSEFLAEKAPKPNLSGKEPVASHESLFGFQSAIVDWAVRRGRAAVFATTGMGKTRMQVEWLRQMATTRPGLIFAPLAVAEQTIAEAATLGVSIRYAKGQEDVTSGIWITNYDRLHRFDPSRYEGVVLDESSILKSVDGKTRTTLLKEWTVIPHRLCCTATPAPNDIAELANHSEFLGVMSRPEMLASFFVHDEQDWRLKGHAQDAFYRWLATWAVYLRRPSDLGFSDAGFDLPELRIKDRTVAVDLAPEGELFPSLMGGVQGRNIARRQSMGARVAESASVIESTPGQWLVWCGLNDEGRSLAAVLGDDCVLIEGSDTPEQKIERERRWRGGAVRVLISKPSIFGFGLNWQHCHQMLFLGLGDSWEQYFQAIRRCWRFGQKLPVDVTIVISEAENKILENVWRKEREAEAVADAVVQHVRDFEQAEVLGGGDSGRDVYDEAEVSGDGWRLLLGDSVERLREVEARSVGLSVHSPPFASLYTYSASDRDLGNSRNYDQFFTHYRFIISELMRATMPGRRACVHVQQVTTTKNTHGVIGWRDFRADVVRSYVETGWVYDGEVVIDKDPQAQAIRTKSKALMFVQKNKDSAWSRPAMADYILLFRAPGDNSQEVKTDVSNEEWIRWARPIWYGIRESETLQASAARTEKDEKHIAPLQLETIERCVRLWSNKGDLVLDPFNGIGSTGYVALQRGRRYLGIELKPEYYRQAARNLASATVQGTLFEAD